MHVLRGGPVHRGHCGCTAVSVYNYDQNVLEGILKSIFTFLNNLESEEKMPERFIKKGMEYFDCQLSKNWNDFKKELVNNLSQNIDSTNNVKKNEVIVDVDGKIH